MVNDVISNANFTPRENKSPSEKYHPPSWEENAFKKAKFFFLLGIITHIHVVWILAFLARMAG